MSYINNHRELKIILRQVDLDWVNSLHGYCDILDLFAITTLMHYEPNLISSLLNSNSTEVSYTNLIAQNDKLESNLVNPKSSELIVRYFLTQRLKTQTNIIDCKVADMISKNTFN